ncbi:hypothetical protein LCGC14_2405160 [marine sediment metagenome]|uniref:Uncharacterized protein n=1 Tax=marine sediment metagenome TaxID=412755 RepID=A0A0F9CG71_9ZZZZ
MTVQEAFNNLKKLVEEGKVPVLLRGTKPGEYERHLREMTRRSSRARPGRKKKMRNKSISKLLQYNQILL